jgi:hypothetical protein
VKKIWNYENKEKAVRKSVLVAFAGSAVDGVLVSVFRIVKEALFAVCVSGVVE